MIAEVVASPKRVWVSSIPEGEDKTVQTVTIQNLSNRSLTVKEVQAGNSRITVTTSNQDALPAVLAPEGSLDLKVTILTSDYDQPFIRDKINVITDNPHTPSLPILVYARLGAAPGSGIFPSRPSPSPLPLPR